MASTNFRLDESQSQKQSITLSLTKESIYSTLDQSKRQIRLITLSPGQIEDPVCCYLSIVSLEEDPEYEALSYVWGNPAERLSILLDGYDVKVTKNLRSALRHLRFQDRIRVMWVDAISVNQDDIAERESQVQQMGEIYKSAQRVLVWLGPHKEDSDEAMDQILELGSAEHISSILDRHQQKGINEIDYKTFYSPLRSWLASAWFQRLWMIQEVALSHTALLYYGNRYISWDDVAKAISWAQRHSDCCMEAMAMLPVEVRIPLLDFRLKTTFIQSLRSRVAVCKSPMSLLEVCRMVQHLTCDDDRDRIYGLLGLVEKSMVQPNYTISVPDLYRQITLAIIADTRSLDVLSHAGRMRKYHALPFWVPDWSSFDHSGSLFASNLVNHVRVSACGSTKAELVDLGQEGISLRGVHLDTIWKTFPATNREPPRTIQGLPMPPIEISKGEITVRALGF